MSAEITHLTPPAMQPQATEALALPAHKHARFAHDMAQFIQQGIAVGADPAALLQQRHDEVHALAHAIMPNSPLAEQFTHHLTTRMNQFLTDPELHARPEEVAVGVENMLTKRQQEACVQKTLLEDTGFVAGLMAPQTKQPTDQLAPGKHDEITRRFVQPNDPDGPEAPIHIVGGAIGQHLLHRAMIDIYNPANGPLVGPIAQGIMAYDPNISPERALTVARGWLNERQGAAIAVVETTKAGGTARSDAMNTAHDAIVARYKPETQVQTDDMQQALLQAAAQKEVM